MREIIVVGAGGHAVSVTEAIDASGYAVKAYVSKSGSNETLLGRPVIQEIPVEHVESGGFLVLAVGDNATREHIWREVISWIPANQFPPIVHPSASVSIHATVAAATVVLQGAVVGNYARVGIACIVNSGSILEHECQMDDFSSLGPGAAVGGQVSIGLRTAIALQASVRHGRTIGADSVLGAGSYAHSDIPAGVVAYGIPARVVRQRSAGDLYL